MHVNALASCKQLIHKLMPRVYEAIQVMRWDQTGHHAPDPVSQWIIARYGSVVQQGPFSGLTYPERSRHGIAPMLLGSYEAELHEVLDVLLARRYTHIVNIGAGTGYYAVGIARRIPRAMIYAFEIDPIKRHQVREMACVNGVANRVVVRGACTLGFLNTLPCADTLIVSDCEGCELGLLTPNLVPGLRSCDLLVEIHDCWNPNISATMMKRFAGSHEIRQIPVSARECSAFPALDDLDQKDRDAALNEGRAVGNWWMVLTPHQAQVASKVG